MMLYILFFKKKLNAPLRCYLLHRAPGCCCRGGRYLHVSPEYGCHQGTYMLRLPHLPIPDTRSVLILTSIPPFFSLPFLSFLFSPPFLSFLPPPPDSFVVRLCLMQYGLGWLTVIHEALCGWMPLLEGLTLQLRWQKTCGISIAFDTWTV